MLNNEIGNTTIDTTHSTNTKTQLTS